MGLPLCHHEGHLPSYYQALPLHTGEEHPPCHICLHYCPPLHNLCNLVPSWLMTKRNTKSRKSWTPGSGGVNYGTWLSSLGGHTQITCGSLTWRSMPQPL